MRKVLLGLALVIALAMAALAYDLKPDNEGAPIPLCQPGHCNGPQC
jgi:hypothetical protein